MSSGRRFIIKADGIITTNQARTAKNIHAVCHPHIAIIPTVIGEIISIPELVPIPANAIALPLRATNQFEIVVLVTSILTSEKPIAMKMPLTK